MKRLLFISILLLLIFIIGICFVILGSFGIYQNVFIGIGTGLIASAVVSEMLEIINTLNERALLKREAVLCFSQYKRAFNHFRDDLPYLYDKLFCDAAILDFTSYIKIVLDSKSYDDLESKEGLDFYYSTIYDIEKHIKSIENAAESLINIEKEIIKNELIYKKINLIKRQRRNCQQIVRSIKVEAFDRTLFHIEKLKDTHLLIFPELKVDFEESYRNED